MIDVRGIGKKLLQMFTGLVINHATGKSGEENVVETP